MPAQTVQAGRTAEQILAPPEGADLADPDNRDAEPVQERAGALLQAGCLVDLDYRCPGTDPTLHQPAQVPDRARMTGADLGDRVMFGRVVGVDRGGEPDPGLGGELEGLLAQLGEVGEHLDQGEADVARGTEQPAKVPVQLGGSPPMNCTLRQPSA